MCALRAQSAVELEPWFQFYSALQTCSTLHLASHTSLVLAHVALAPQVEFELLEGVQQQNISGQAIR